MRVLLVGASGFDANIANGLADAGAMPAFAAFRAQASAGRLHVVHPPRGPLNWVSALTGAAPHEHGIAATTALDLETGVEQPVSMANSPFKPVWRHFTERGKRSVAVNWPASTGIQAIKGEIIVGDRFFDAHHSAPQRESEVAVSGIAAGPARGALSKLRVTARDLDRATLAAFVPRLDLVEATGDQRIARLASALTRAFSVHAVSTHLLETEPSDLTAVHYDLLQQISDDFLLYAAPQHDAASDRDHAVWGAVVDASYRVFDLFLARLAALAGPECRVALVADSGYRMGAGRPAGPVRTPEEADNWRNGKGFAAIVGPGVETKPLVGAHIRGLASTVCTLGDLEETVPWQLPAWLSFAGNVKRAFTFGDGREPTVANAAMPWSETEMARVQQLLSDEGHSTAARALLEARYAMAQSLDQVGEIRQAAGILEQIVTLQPHSLRWQSTLFELNLARRDFGAAQRQIEAAVTSALDPVLIAVARAQLLLAKRDPDAALAALQTAPSAALMLRTKADCHARLGHWSQAESDYRRAIALAPRVGAAYEGLGRCLLAQERFAEVAALAMESEAVFGATALSSYHLGIACYRMDEIENALLAWERCIAIAPSFAPAYHKLTSLFRFHRPEPVKAAMYHALGRVARNVRLKRRATPPHVTSAGGNG